MASLGRLSSCLAAFVFIMCAAVLMVTIWGHQWTILLGLKMSGGDLEAVEESYLLWREGEEPPPNMAEISGRAGVQPEVRSVKGNYNDFGLESLVPCNAPADDMSEHEKAGPWARGRQRDMASAWLDFSAEASKTVHKQKYCVAQCGLDKCCVPRGWRSGQGWLKTVKDDLPSYSKDSGFSEVTLVSQGSFDRLDIFGMIADAWPGPKVALFAIYNHTDKYHKIAEQQLFDIEEAAEDWENVKVLVYTVQWDRDFYSKKINAQGLPTLPLNTFRNIVLDNAKTNFVFTVDMDFVPSHTLYPKFTKYLMPIVASIDRAVVVVPHWEALTCNNEIRIPRDFHQLDHYSRDGKVRPFHADTPLLVSLDYAFPDQRNLCQFEPSATWTSGIQTTNYHRWYEESHNGIDGFFPLNVAGPMYDKFYEPFTIVRRVESNGFRLPRYEEKYVGRYKNKISFVTQLRGYHYQFFTLRQEFLMHVPHPVANTTDPAMKEHLFNMRRLNKADREALHKLYTSPEGILMPKLRTSPFDQGVECKFDI